MSWARVVRLRTSRAFHVKSPRLYEHKCKTPFCSCASLPSSCIVRAIRKGTVRPLGSRWHRENCSQRERGLSACGGPRFTRPRGGRPQKGRLPDFRQRQTTSYLWIQHSKSSEGWESSDGCWTHASQHWHCPINYAQARSFHNDAGSFHCVLVRRFPLERRGFGADPKSSNEDGCWITG